MPKGFLFALSVGVADSSPKGRAKSYVLQQKMNRKRKTDITDATV